MKRVSIYGDSTMAGVVWTPAGYIQSPDTVPVLVGRILGAGVTVSGKAIGGTTTSDWLFGQGQVPRPWTAEMAASDAHLVCINTGINDAYIPEIGPQDYTWRYGEIARIARQYGKTIVFITPNLINQPHLPRLAGLKNALTEFAPLIGVPVIDVWAAIYYANTGAWQTGLPDGTHPSPALYRFIASAVALGLAPILKNMGAEVEL